MAAVGFLAAPGPSRETPSPASHFYDLADRLRLRGWQVPAYPMPEHRTDLRRAESAGAARTLAAIWRDCLLVICSAQ